MSSYAARAAAAFPSPAGPRNRAAIASTIALDPDGSGDGGEPAEQGRVRERLAKAPQRERARVDRARVGARQAADDVREAEVRRATCRC